MAMNELENYLIDAINNYKPLSDDILFSLEKY